MTSDTLTIFAYKLRDTWVCDDPQPEKGFAITFATKPAPQRRAFGQRSKTA